MKQPQQAEKPRAHPAWLIIISLSIPMFMASLDNLVVTNALPVIRADLGATLEELTWTVNAYTLTFASCILMSSALADRFVPSSRPVLFKESAALPLCLFPLRC